MGKKRVIAETGAGQHGVATATAAALFGLTCRVYMGAEDVRRQELNVFKMRAMGTEVFPVDKRQQDARATRSTRRCATGWHRRGHALHHRQRRRPAPVPDDGPRFPVASSARRRSSSAWSRSAELPDVVVACVGGGSNAAGMFYPFVDDAAVELVGVEAGGRGATLGEHAATLSFGKPGVLHGSFSYVLQDDDGQTADVHSVSAGLDYPGVGPEHSYWKDADRVRYSSVTDAEALDAFQLCGRLEGILPALETAHAVVETMRIAAKRPKTDVVVLCFSGRGDKDCAEVARAHCEKVTVALLAICDHGERRAVRPT